MRALLAPLPQTCGAGDRGERHLARQQRHPVDEASKIEQAEYLGTQPYERNAARRDHANGIKPKMRLISALLTEFDEAWMTGKNLPLHEPLKPHVTEIDLRAFTAEKLRSLRRALRPA
ncbi:MAG: hypothetical protein ACK6DI_12325 [Betaproteobacteria bacterium]|jgi:hypothetical protein